MLRHAIRKIHIKNGLGYGTVSETILSEKMYPKKKKNRHLFSDGFKKGAALGVLEYQIVSISFWQTVSLRSTVQWKSTKIVGGRVSTCQVGDKIQNKMFYVYTV